MAARRNSNGNGMGCSSSVRVSGGCCSGCSGDSRSGNWNRQWHHCVPRFLVAAAATHNVSVGGQQLGRQKRTAGRWR